MKKVLLTMFLLLSVFSSQAITIAEAKYDENNVSEYNSPRTRYDWWQYDLVISGKSKKQFNGPVSGGTFLIHKYNSDKYNYYHRIYIDFGDNTSGEVKVWVYCKDPSTGKFVNTTSFTVRGKGQVSKDFQVCNETLFSKYTDEFKIYIENTKSTTVGIVSVGLVTEDYEG